MLDLALVERGIAGSGFSLDYRPLTASTNEDARGMLGDARSTGRTIVAEAQSHGRGRHGRAWIAPAGSSLLFTAILPTAVPTRSLWAVPFLCALAVADGIEEATGLRVGLQWPNDLLLGARKCCGILCVSRSSGDLAHVGCGIGINVRRPADAGDLASVEPPPAFLSDDAPAVTREVVLVAVLRALARRAPHLADPDGLAGAWERRADLSGTPYRLLVDGETEPIDAIAERLAPDGSLIVTTKGSERTISLADARVLR